MPTLLTWYPYLKTAHIALVLASGSLFALRGIAVLWAARWPMRRCTRIASQCIDSALLLAAVLILVALRGHFLAQPWLQMKLTLLLAYILSGMFALRRAATRRGKAFAFGLALLCFSQMLVIARTRNPWGWLVYLG